MRPNPFDGHYPNIECNLRFQPVIISLYVEDDYVTRQKAGAGVSKTYIVSRLPMTILYVTNPVLKPSATIRVCGTKIVYAI
jgi:hypothetical protein